MFRIFERARYGGVRLGYDGEDNGPDHSKAVDPLDPISADTVGRFRIRSALTYTQGSRAGAIASLIGTIVGGQFPRWIGEVRSTRKSVIGERYRGHIDALEECGLIGRPPAGGVLCYSSYFAVPKGEGLTRSIFNGRALSLLCPRPAPVNLLNGHRFLAQLREQLKLHKRCFVVEGDLRHWFHQIPVCPEVQRLFGLRTTSREFAWRSLPMGWSWSPAIAQACAWSFLLFRREGEEAVFGGKALEESHLLPFWLPVLSKQGAVVGIAVVYYDNFFVAVPDENEARRVFKRLSLNARDLNVEIKGGINLHTDQDIRLRGVQYLGMFITWNADALVVKPAKLAQWRSDYPSVPADCSCRVAAEILGRALFAVMIGEENLRRSPQGREVIRLARVIGLTVRDGGWANPFLDREALQSLWSQILSMETTPQAWSRRQSDRPAYSGELVVATDASKAGWGVVIWRRKSGTLQLLHECSGMWSATETSTHIFLLEMDAAVRGIRMSSSWLDRADMFTIVGDNVAVSWALRQGYTRNAAGMAQLDSLGDARMPDRVITVISADNPADEPSRGRGLNSERIRAMSSAILAEDQGFCYTSQRPELWTDETRRRLVVHEGPDDEEDEVIGVIDAEAVQAGRDQPLGFAP